MRPNGRRSLRPNFDTLDGRALLSGVSANLAGGVLTITGTEAADAISAQLTRGRAPGGMVVVDGAGRFRARKVKVIVVNAGGGDDAVQLDARLAARTRVDLGAGANSINGVMIPGPAAPVATPTARPETVANPRPRPVVTPVGAPAPGASNVSDATDGGLVAQITSLINAERTKVGLAPLTLSVPLGQAAQLQAEAMGTLDRMDHVLAEAAYPTLSDRIGHVGYRYARVGENIAYGYSDATSVVNGWMASAGHRANILNAAFTDTGVAIVRNAEGELYFAQVFGSVATW